MNKIIMWSGKIDRASKPNLFSSFKLILIISGLLLSSFCSKAQQQQSAGKEVLIVYLSRTNNTKAIAEMIHKKVGGKLVALELQNPYPKENEAIVAQVDHENETGYLPPLKTRIDSMEQYGTVFLGFPTWDMQLPPPMKSFLHEYDLSGKTVIPFNTNGGYGVGSGFETVKELSPNSTVLEGFSIKGGLERNGIYLAIKGERAKEAEAKVTEWLRRIKFL
jgi:flavodoxin